MKVRAIAASLRGEALRLTPERDRLAACANDLEAECKRRWAAWHEFDDRYQALMAAADRLDPTPDVVAAAE